jgi:cation/acetate symporter
MTTTLAIFAMILLTTLGITYWAARRTTTTSGF